ncbi:MAG: endoplasmic oxidoreductin-1 [Candelina submexicana]|nr:MAG: endoplasmic oxidoreductin-1 [Candelina submexicana]
MRTSIQLFYLAVFGLLGCSHADSKSPTKSRSSSPDICGIAPKSIVSDACASYDTLDSLNTALTPSLKSITQTTDFFAYYRLNLFDSVCPFWDDANSMCGNIACAVNTLEHEEDIPKIWRAEELSKLEGPKAGHPNKRLQQERGAERPLQGMLGDDVGESCVLESDDECDERDYCVPEDESASAKGDYVSLVDNPEKFTGYGGPGARQVWDAIYRENCFSKSPPPIRAPQDGSLTFGSLSSQASSDLRNVLRQRQRQQALDKNGSTAFTDIELDDGCLEKRVFYRVISGMHASISSHVCWDYLNQTTGTWGPNLQCYEERLHSHPDRVSNLYFNYALVLRAVGKLRNHLQKYTFCSGDIQQDLATKQKMLRLSSQIPSGPQIFDESLMFADPSVSGLKEDFRNRFRNVSRLMECVGCDKCRLWGKLQTAGYGAALKVLFDFDEFDDSKNMPLRRTELVALINTLDRISSSLGALENFRKMVLAQQEGSPMGEAERNRIFEEGKRSVILTEELPNEEDVEWDVECGHDEDQDAADRAAQDAWDSAVEEWYRVWRAWVFVMQSWIQMPGNV